MTAAAAAWIAVIIAMALVHFALEPARWTLYAKALRRDRGWRLMLQIFSLTALTTYLVPLKLGVPLRLWLLGNRAGIPATESVALTTLDGVLYYATWGVASLAGLMLVGSGAQELAGIETLAIGVLALLPLALWLRRRRRAAQPDAQADKGAEPRGRMAGLLERMAGAASAIPLPVLLGAVVLMALDVITYGVRHWALASMAGVPMSLPIITAIAAISLFAGLASLMPMGLGGYDVVLIALLTQSGVPMQAAIGIALGNRLANVAVALALGGWGALRLGISPLKAAPGQAERG